MSVEKFSFWQLVRFHVNSCSWIWSIFSDHFVYSLSPLSLPSLPASISYQVTEDEVDRLASAIVPSCTSYSEDFAKFTYYPLISPETETVVVSEVVAWYYHACVIHN